MVYAAVIIGAKKPKNAVVFTIVKITLFLLMVCAAQEIFCGGSYNTDENKNIFVNLYSGGSAFRGGGGYAFVPRQTACFHVPRGQGAHIPREPSLIPPRGGGDFP